MQLPVDVPEIFKVATDMKEVVDTKISVSIYIDDSAPGVLIGHVRSVLASAGENTRVTIDYVDEGGVRIKPNEDMSVIIAGTNVNVGKDASMLREAGVPVMVVCDNPEAVIAISRDAGFEIPAADVIAPEPAANPVVDAIKKKVPCPFKKKPFGKLTDGSDVADKDQEIELDEASFKILDERMGKWIITACSEKQLAFALSFPFVRRPLATDAILATSAQNAAIGLLPFLPGADMPVMTLNQVKMALQIATAYGKPLDQDRVKEIVFVVAGAFVSRNIVRSVNKVLPVGKCVVSGAMGYAATSLLGFALLEYFEAGGDLVGIASVVQKARDKAMTAARDASETKAGQAAFSKLTGFFGKKAMNTAK